MSWDKPKSAKEIAAQKKSSQFLDLMQWRVARSNPAGTADDGCVLQYRLFDKGKKTFSWNVNMKTMTPTHATKPFLAAVMGFGEIEFTLSIGRSR